MPASTNAVTCSLWAESGKTQDARGAVLFASVLQSRVDYGHRKGALGRDAHAFARAGTAHVCLAEYSSPGCRSSEASAGFSVTCSVYSLEGPLGVSPVSAVSGLREDVGGCGLTQYELVGVRRSE